jgi:hypothetical protein
VLGAPPLPVPDAPPLDTTLVPPEPAGGPEFESPPLELEQATAPADSRKKAARMTCFVMPMRKAVEKTKGWS